jgi:hypothetical protein
MGETVLMEGAVGFDDWLSDPSFRALRAREHDFAETAVETHFERVLFQCALKSMRDVKSVEGNDSSGIRTVPINAILRTHWKNARNVGLDEEFWGEFGGFHRRSGDAMSAKRADVL